MDETDKKLSRVFLQYKVFHRDQIDIFTYWKEHHEKKAFSMLAEISQQECN